MAHAQKPNFVFRRNGRVHLNRQGRQFSRLLAAEVCASAVVMLGTACSEAVWRVLATHSIRQFPLHFPSRASTCAITFQLDSTTDWCSLLLSVDSIPNYSQWSTLMYIAHIWYSKASSHLEHTRAYLQSNLLFLVLGNFKKHKPRVNTDNEREKKL